MLLRNQLSVALYLVLAFRWDIKGICSRGHVLSIRVRGHGSMLCQCQSRPSVTDKSAKR